MSYLCNQILKTVCPCLFSKKKDLSHYGDNQLIQRQQFIVPDSIDHQYQIKHKSFDSNHFQQSTRNSTSQTSTLSKSIQQQKDQLLNSMSQQTQQITIIGTSSLSDQIIYHDYTDVLPADHTYYDILYPKLQTLSSLFDIDPKYLLQASPDPFPLEIYCKQSQVRKTNSFIYFFQFFNTNYEAYQSLLNNFQLQKSFDSNINEYYKKVESPNNDTKVIYLSYNKVLIIAPRDFVYVRYVFKKGQQFWSVSTSIPNQEQIKGKIRGQIVLTATKVVQKDNKIQVQVYSEVNMKMAIKPQMAKNRGKAQIKKYLQKCYKHLSENKNQSIL